ncbi:MAG: hypothetical protein HQL21_06880 [Candidatus Omnitrophica bacterium]|nr:hypothetical protein [Candidatus Omnitrophota bacterium]
MFIDGGFSNIKTVFVVRALRLFLAVLIAMPAPVYAQVVTVKLSTPGTLVALSDGFSPAVLRGVKVSLDSPFRFDFLVDSGASGLSGVALQGEADKLIRYFLASMTLAEKELWVNLSPYENDRIIPEAFGLTAMGRDVLSQDYLLKQVTSSLIHPDQQPGKSFWEKVYAKAYQEYGTTDVPVDTFNKVWIVPDQAVVNEEGNRAVVSEAKFKVMLESDYVAQSTADRQVTGVAGSFDPKVKSQNSREIAKNVLREVVIPILEREVNEGKNFAPLRQVYYSLILATWYKKRFYESVLARVYADKDKVIGVGHGEEDMARRIYSQYLESFKKGAFNFIREDFDQNSQEVLPRKYFSGGCNLKVPLKTKQGPTSAESGPLTVFNTDLSDKPQFAQKAWTPSEEEFLGIVTKAWGVLGKDAGQSAVDFIKAGGADGYGVYTAKGILEGAADRGFVVFGKYPEFQRALEEWTKTHPELSSQKEALSSRLSLSAKGFMLLENVEQHADGAPSGIVVYYDKKESMLRIAAVDGGERGFQQYEGGKLKLVIQQDGKIGQDESSPGVGNAMRILSDKARFMAIISHGLQARAEAGARGIIPSVPYDGPHRGDVARLSGTAVFFEYDVAELAHKAWRRSDDKFLGIVTKAWGVLGKDAGQSAADFIKAGGADGYGVYKEEGGFLGSSDKGFVVFGENPDLQNALSEWWKTRPELLSQREFLSENLSPKAFLLFENVETHAEGALAGAVVSYDQRAGTFRISVFDAGKNGFPQDERGQLKVVVKESGNFVQGENSHGQGMAMGILFNKANTMGVISHGLQARAEKGSRGIVPSVSYDGPRQGEVAKLPGTAVFVEYDLAEYAQAISIDPLILDHIFKFYSKSGTQETLWPDKDKAEADPQYFLELMSAIAGDLYEDNKKPVVFSTGPIARMEFFFDRQKMLIIKFVLRDGRGYLREGPTITLYDVFNPANMRFLESERETLPGWVKGADPKEFLLKFVQFLKVGYQTHLENMQRDLPAQQEVISSETSVEVVEGFDKHVLKDDLINGGRLVNVFPLKEDQGFVVKEVLNDFWTKEAALVFVHNSVLPDYMTDLRYYRDVIVPYERIVISREGAIDNVGGVYRVYFVQERLEPVPRNVSELDPIFRAFKEMAKKYVLALDKQREARDVDSILEVKGRISGFANTGVDKQGNVRIFDLDHVTLAQEPAFVRNSREVLGDLVGRSISLRKKSPDYTDGSPPLSIGEPAQSVWPEAKKNFIGRAITAWEAITQEPPMSAAGLNEKLSYKDEDGFLAFFDIDPDGKVDVFSIRKFLSGWNQENKRAVAAASQVFHAYLLENITQHATDKDRTTPGAVMFYFDKERNVIQVAVMDRGKEGMPRDEQGRLSLTIRDNYKFSQRLGTPGFGLALKNIYVIAEDLTIMSHGQYLNPSFPKGDKGKIPAFPYKGESEDIVRTLPGTLVYVETPAQSKPPTKQQLEAFGLNEKGEPLDDPVTPGGVDLDPSRIRMDIKGHSVLGIMSAQDIRLLDQKITGLVPVIIGSSTVNSLKDFLEG